MTTKSHDPVPNWEYSTNSQYQERSVMSRAYRRHKADVSFRPQLIQTSLQSILCWVRGLQCCWNAPEALKSRPLVFEPTTHSPLPSRCLNYPSLPHAKGIPRKVVHFRHRIEALHTAVRIGSMTAANAVRLIVFLTNNRRFQIAECRKGLFQRRPGTSLHRSPSSILSPLLHNVLDSLLESPWLFGDVLDALEWKGIKYCDQ
ncbi:hypothetical protein BDZ45DRAFT_751299 [Acephala macrosclerotiorum]|nr:hypothetical protein BDZ45DRAFT_751299 [Acephala macrosclerotiorum]